MHKKKKSIILIYTSLLITAVHAHASQEESPLKNLYKAASEGNVYNIQLCLAQGANINRPRRADGHTALHIACKRGREAVVQVLLTKSGIQINARNNNLRTPLQEAVRYGHTPVAKLLLEANAHGNQVNLLCDAAVRGHAGVVQLLIERGIDIEKRDSNGYKPLWRAVSAGQPTTTALLLEAGANPNDKTKYGESMIQMAVDRHHVAVAQLLLKRGAHSPIFTPEEHTAWLEAVAEYEAYRID